MMRRGCTRRRPVRTRLPERQQTEQRRPPSRVRPGWMTALTFWRGPPWTNSGGRRMRRCGGQAWGAWRRTLCGACSIAALCAASSAALSCWRRERRLRRQRWTVGAGAAWRLRRQARPRQRPRLRRPPPRRWTTTTTSSGSALPWLALCAGCGSCGRTSRVRRRLGGRRCWWRERGSRRHAGSFGSICVWRCCMPCGSSGSGAGAQGFSTGRRPSWRPQWQRCSGR